MTTHQLARGDLRKCEDRLAALDVLVRREAWSDVVRESQEIVELALKGLLRMIGVDPPKCHDVSDLLVEYAERFTALPREEIDYLAAASKSLRKEREFSFYGDIDFIPTAEYDSDDGTTAAEQARRAAAALATVVREAGA
jgi:HEPN domain-containing protein